MERESGSGGRPSRPPERERQGLSDETVFDVLSNRRRRYALFYLRQVDRPVEIRELSEILAAWENDCPREEVTGKERKRLYTALHQTHLPRMVQSGAVRYDVEEGTVELAPASAVFGEYLTPPDPGTRRRETNRGTVVLGVAAAVLGVLLSLGVEPFVHVEPVLYLFGFAVASFGLGAVRALWSRTPGLPTPLPALERSDD